MALYYVLFEENTSIIQDADIFPESSIVVITFNVSCVTLTSVNQLLCKLVNNRDCLMRS